MTRVAIQGIRASFHDLAARSFFPEGSCVPVECASFKRLCDALSTGEADFGVMAIENTIAGSILPNYSLLEQYRFKTLGEVYLRIGLNLLALPGQKIEDLKSVKSHPMALIQCAEFLSRHPHLKILEGADTAESASEISRDGISGAGAIASQLAARTFGLALLAPGIETDPRNYTRFLVICRERDYKMPENADKSSLRFETAHKPGSLADALDIFRRKEINLTKIQSVPILGKPYQYSIHVDLEWADRGDYLTALGELGNRASQVLSFGEYKRGERPVL